MQLMICRPTIIVQISYTSNRHHLIYMNSFLYFCLGLGLLAFTPLVTTAQTAQNTIVLEDFEAYEPGGAPTVWKRPHKKSKSFLELPDAFEIDDDFVEVVLENGNKVGRIFSSDNTEQIALLNGDTFRWNIDQHPVLAWRWKASQLPTGAREDASDHNDSGGALYVTFDSKDWLGRPRTIKYSYSSTLPVGSKASYGALRVLVVSSGTDGLGSWIDIKRNVAEDYNDLFGRSAPKEPGYIMLWGDSDNTKSTSDVFFDDIRILTL